MSDNVVTELPLVLLRSEGVSLLAMATVLYVKVDRSWWLFVVLLLAPDLGMLAYVRSTRVGALTYDLAHTYGSARDARHPRVEPGDRRRTHLVRTHRDGSSAGLRPAVPGRSWPLSPSRRQDTEARSSGGTRASTT